MASTAYNPFTSLKFIPNFQTGHILQWTLDRGFRAPAPYSFTLEMAETVDFSVLLLANNVGDSFFAVDTANLKNISESFYYRVKLVAAEKTYYSSTLQVGNNQEDRTKYLLAAEITRKELLRMRLKTGHAGLFLKRKTYGPIGSSLVDEVTNEPVADAPPDFGTGIDGGYYPPVKILFSYEGQRQAKALDPSGKGIAVGGTVNYRMVGFPLVSNRDVVVDTGDGLRYSISNWQQTLFPGTNISLIQRGTMELITPTDPIYGVPI